MAKAPIAGFAKTRLIPLLGAAGAARAQREFVLRTLATATAVEPESLTLCCAPDEQQRFFRALHRSARFPLRLDRQTEGGLGLRMADIFAAHARIRAAGSGERAPARPAPLLLVGTDCPALAPAHLLEAAAALASGFNVVFAPVEDGGYVLVGLRDPAKGDFGIFSDIDWSSDRVMSQSRARLRAAGVRWHELGLLWDVDEPGDWRRWQALRQQAP